jgi:two-component system, NarL family, response regulator LiaR
MKDVVLLITPREKEVLHFLSKGLTYKQMSEKMEVSPETVKKHLKNIYRKLKVQNKIER